MDFVFIGFPDNPPFWCFWIFIKLSLDESDVFEITTPLTLLLKRTCDISSISLSITSGDTFTTIGIFELRFFFSFSILFSKSSNCFWLWNFLKFSVFGDDMLIVI